MAQATPIVTLPLFAELDRLLLELLQSLTPADWQRPTPARAWTVHDVAAHLLDGNLRTLSMLRDGHFGEAPPADASYPSLVAYLDGLNTAGCGPVVGTRLELVGAVGSWLRHVKEWKKGRGRRPRAGPWAPRVI